MSKRLILWCFCIVFSICFLCGCAPKQQPAGEYRFTDASGETVALNKTPRRVVSLMGSYAEVWLLSGGELVGVTSDVIEENRFEIPEGVEIIGSVKHPNAEEILALNPDFVLMSMDIAGHVQIAPLLKTAGIPCAFFKTESFQEYLNMLKICTDLTGRADLYEQNGLSVKARVDSCIAGVTADSKPSVLFLRVYSTGAKAKGSKDHMTARMIADLGGENLADRYPSLFESLELNMEIIIREDPDVILAVPMGDETAAEETLNAMLKEKSWQGLTAVKNHRYQMLPKNLFHYKPNAKWAESYEYLKKVLYE